MKSHFIKLPVVFTSSSLSEGKSRNTAQFLKVLCKKVLRSVLRVFLE